MLLRPLLLRSLLVYSSPSTRRGATTTACHAASPRVHIVGAGLHLGHLTREACTVLAEADVVLHDDLGVDPGALRAEGLVSPDCQMIAVGKRGGRGERGAPLQAAINAELVASANTGARVVRLKGGDPFVFGRSRSECEALQVAGHAYRVLPGVSSTLAAPLLAGIPLSDPACGASSFAVFSGADTKGQLASGKWDNVNAAADTLIFLMAGSRFGDICRALTASGRAPTEPAVLIRHAGRGRAGGEIVETSSSVTAATATENENGDSSVNNDINGVEAQEAPEQAVWRGTLSSLESVVCAATAPAVAAKIGDTVQASKSSLSPCVLVIGPTAGLDLSSVADSEVADAVVAAAAPAAEGAPHKEVAATAAPPQFTLSAFDDYLLDLDGVLWQGSNPIPGALEAARALLRDCTTPPSSSSQSSPHSLPSQPSSSASSSSPKESTSRPRRVFFVTNNSAKTRAEYAATLSQRLGVPVQESQVITSGWAAAQLLASSTPGTVGQQVTTNSLSSGRFLQRQEKYKSERVSDDDEDIREATQLELPRTVFALGSAALATELLAAGLQVITPADHGVSASTVMTPDLYAAMELDSRVDAVVIGWSPEAWHYAGLCLASAYANEHHRLRDDDDGDSNGTCNDKGGHSGNGENSRRGNVVSPPVDLVATNPDLYNVLSDTSTSTSSSSTTTSSTSSCSQRKSRVRRLPENGCAVAFVESTLGSSSGSRDSSSNSNSNGEQRRFVAAGKPSRVLANLLTASLDLNPSRTLMVGDRLDTDVSFASQGEFSSALVLTGVASADDANTAIGASKPTFVFESFSALVQEEEWLAP